MNTLFLHFARFQRIEDCKEGRQQTKPDSIGLIHLRFRRLYDNFTVMNLWRREIGNVA